MTLEDKRAPMASAPMAYNEDGSADRGNMWDSVCVLAQEGNQLTVQRASKHPPMPILPIPSTMLSQQRSYGVCSKPVGYTRRPSLAGSLLSAPAERWRHG
jgi:hypothetical protein